MAYVRASDIPGPNLTLFGMGEVEAKGAGSNWDGLGGPGVRVTGLGGGWSSGGRTGD